MLNPINNNEFQMILDAMIASGYLEPERANNLDTRKAIEMNLSMMRWFLESGLELGNDYEKIYSCALLGGGAPPALVTGDIAEAMNYIFANPTYYITTRWRKKI